MTTKKVASKRPRSIAPPPVEIPDAPVEVPEPPAPEPVEPTASPAPPVVTVEGDRHGAHVVIDGIVRIRTLSLAQGEEDAVPLRAWFAGRT